MKLRLQSNSVRLRLKRGEVDQLVKLGQVQETILLGDGPDDQLVYTLESSPKVFAPKVSLKKNHVLVEVPRDTAVHWATSNDVGIETRISVGGGREVQVLIEKDFACLNGTEEQNRDTFPNPLDGQKC
ncbi:MAG TPA: hypothetical protein VHY09_13060 [Candidatus Methylacidiphilales bacterium]|jgi:hypothetical protein|nr:hypothetical protein [Candidatus Methylacidiphilales bacterium]